jgi:hypothetical protein
MYKGPLTEAPAFGSSVAPVAPAPPPPPVLPPPPPAESASRALGVYTDDTPKARNEAWARLHGDPMLLARRLRLLRCCALTPLSPQIRQQEQAALKSLRANPVKMDAIKREVELAKAERRGRKESRREAKEARREARRQRRARHGGRSSSRGSEDSRGGRRSRSRSRERPPVSAVSDAACAQRGSHGYGLTFASAEAEASARARAEAPRGAYARAERGAPVAEPPAQWVRGLNSARHAAGRLSEEERAARLRAMAADAEAHEEQRWERHRAAPPEAAAPLTHHSEKPAFLEQQEQQLFGTRGDASVGALAERVGARKHYREREQHV